MAALRLEASCVDIPVFRCAKVCTRGVTDKSESGGITVIGETQQYECACAVCIAIKSDKIP